MAVFASETLKTACVACVTAWICVGTLGMLYGGYALLFLIVMAAGLSVIMLPLSTSVEIDVRRRLREGKVGMGNTGGAGCVIEKPKSGCCTAACQTQWGRWVRCRRPPDSGDEHLCWQHRRADGGGG